MSASVISPVGSGHANEVVLKRLGAAAVCASRLERLIGEIARDLKVGEDASALGRLRGGDFTVPPWATTKAADVTGWAAVASRLLSVRASVFAASGGARFTGTRGDTIATESSDGSIFPADEEYLGRFVGRLDRHIIAGMELHEGLDYRDENGQRWPLVSIYRQSLESPEPEHRIRIPADWERWLSA
jgi:hypothetical protein